jgi:hypothetical protein
VLYPAPAGEGPALLTPDGPLTLAVLPTDVVDEKRRTAPMDGPTLGAGAVLFLVPADLEEDLFRVQDIPTFLPPTGTLTPVVDEEVERTSGVVVRRAKLTEGRYAWISRDEVARGPIKGCRMLVVLGESDLQVEQLGRAVGRLLQLSTAQEVYLTARGEYSPDLTTLGLPEIIDEFRFKVVRDAQRPGGAWRAEAAPVAGRGACFVVERDGWVRSVAAAVDLADWSTPLPGLEVFSESRGSPSLGLATSAQAMRLLYAGRCLDAIEPLGASLYARPMVETWNNLAHAFLELRQFGRARKCCLGGIELQKTVPSPYVKLCWNNLGLALMGSSDGDDELTVLRAAERAFMTALELDPQYVKAASNLAVCRSWLFESEPTPERARALVEAVKRVEQDLRGQPLDPALASLAARARALLDPR